MKVHRLRSQPFDVNAWLVECGRGEWLLADATTGADFPLVQRQLEATGIDPRTIKAVWCSHYHCDHCGGAAAFHALTGACVYAHELEVEAIRQGDNRATLGAFVGLPQAPCPSADSIREGSEIRVGDRVFQVLHLPGHTAGHTALYDPASKTLFSGDLVFEQGSFGRVDFPTGDAKALARSLDRLAKLDLAAIYPGHMDPMLGPEAHRGVELSLRNLEFMLESEQLY